jgi:hypothetical protein
MGVLHLRGCKENQDWSLHVRALITEKKSRVCLSGFYERTRIEYASEVLNAGNSSRIHMHWWVFREK